MTIASPSAILITGVTGFIGGAVALEYLATTDATLFCLTRGADADDAHGRTIAALTVAANAYHRTDLLTQINDRVHTVVGDVSSTDIDFTDINSVDLVVHMAASLKYKEKHAEEITRINVGGTANVIRLAKALGARRLCHVSTAYVAGRKTGEIDEIAMVSSDDEFNNAYERSKVAGEQLVMDSGIDYQILRPSIVIGHSHTLAATSFTGMYGAFEGFRQFKTQVAEHLGSGFLEDSGIRLLVDPAIELNLIPIDVAAQAIARISMADTDAQIFHIANGAAPTVEVCMSATFDLLGLPRPTYVDRPEQLTEIDRYLQTEFYDLYLRNGKTFSLKHSEAVLGAGALDFQIDQDTFVDFVSWYMDSGQRVGGRLTLACPPGE